VVVHVDDREAVSAMMQLAAATVARHWNRLKGHEGSFWEHPFQCTLVQDGQHLLNCIRYVSLNMVRAGVVDRPSAWRWSGDDELTGRRMRYRMLAPDRMLESLDLPSMAAFERLYHRGIAEALARRRVHREPAWTEALAVGDQAFVEQAACSLSHRLRFAYGDAAIGIPGTKVLRETLPRYS
jgi:putative transposase